MFEVLSGVLQWSFLGPLLFMHWSMSSAVLLSTRGTFIC